MRKKIELGSQYVRRRDKAVVVINSADAQGVNYTTCKAKTTHRVTLDGFRAGFRPVTDKERVHEAPAVVPTAGNAGG